MGLGPWEEKESQKDSPGLKEKSEEIAASEQNTSKGKDRSLLPCSNKKRKTCTTRLAGIEPKYIWMPLLIPVLFIFIPGADGLKVQRRDFRKIIIGMNEVKMVTDPILRPVDDSVYSVFAKDGNDDHEGFECTPGFVSTNPSCIIVVGDTSKAECEGLQISGNASYLAVVGSELTHDRTTYCIYQQVPKFFILYTLEVSKKREQDINDCASYPCQNGGACLDGLDSYTCNCAKGYDGANCESDINECAPNPCQNGGACVDGLDSYTCNCAKGYGGANCEIAPETNHYKVAFYILLGIDVFILLVIAIVIKKNFPCIRAWWKKYIMKQESTDHIEGGSPSPTVGTPMLPITVAHEHRDE
eukprot:XP_011682310.1 PREDICTED: sushi, von Willebrand factor type A, EGF and pentraxin domain-containing protein 1 [Strongylocentrotus purpuratus]